MSKPRIRPATKDDAATIAEIHVGAWRESYAELMPAEALARFDVAERARRWREIFRSAPAGDLVLLLSFDEDPPCGFASCGRQRVERLEAQRFSGEFQALYVLRRGQRRGGGRALMRVMARHLLDQGWKSATVWVFRDNRPARRFYGAMGAVETGEEGVWETPLGVTLPDMAYGWRNLAGLAR
jgi:L-amino acid N-acyltransferase YncA